MLKINSIARKALSAVLSAAMLTSVFAVSASAAESPFSANLNVDGDTAKVTITASKDCQYGALQLEFDGELPAGITCTDITKGEKFDDVFKPGIAPMTSLESGGFGFFSADFEKDTPIPSGSELAVYTFDTSKAANGSHTITFIWTSAGDIDQNPYDWRDSKISVTINKGSGSNNGGGNSGGGGGGSSATSASLKITGGTASPEKPASGDEVTIKADQKEGYTFSGWKVTSGNVTIKNAKAETTTFKMTSESVAIEAEYTQDSSSNNNTGNGGSTGSSGSTETPSGDHTNCPSAPFKDVDTNAWYHTSIDYAVEKSLMNGVSADSFDPNGTLTRAMLVAILYRLEGSPDFNNTNSFGDVKASDWFANAVLWANANGVVSGYDNGNFGPNDPITREQMASILYRYEKLKGGGFTGAWSFRLEFDDIDKLSSWADEAMHWCVMNNLISGVGGNTLDPKGNATRAQVASIIMRFIENER